MSLSIKFDASKWRKALHRAPGLIATASKNAVNTIAARVRGEISKNGLSGRPGLKRRTGTLKNSLIQTLTSAPKAEKAWVGFVLPGARYAAIHETGGTITGNGKLLAIPVGPALTPAGAPRFPAGPRTVQGLTFRPARGGGLLGKTVGKGENAKFVVWFVLRKSVRIPARMGFKRTWLAFFASDKPQKIIRTEMAKAIKAINGVP